MLGYTTEVFLAQPFLKFVYPVDFSSMLDEVTKSSQDIATTCSKNQYCGKRIELFLVKQTQELYVKMSS